MDIAIKTDLTGQVAIVTGASQGLGKAVAIALGMNGATVLCLARSADKLKIQWPPLKPLVAKPRRFLVM